MEIATLPGAVSRQLLNMDGAVRKAVLPYRRNLAVKALSWFSEVGDQPQMRALCAGYIAIGLLRADARMVRAGSRMLVSHELATAAKSFIKHRVDRSRPRSAARRSDEALRPGHSSEKEESSFPSGHSAGAMAVASAFAADYPRFSAPAYGAAGAVALAQIPRCAHYPTDVGAGLLIGAGAGALVRITAGAAFAAWVRKR